MSTVKSITSILLNQILDSIYSLYNYLSSKHPTPTFSPCVPLRACLRLASPLGLDQSHPKWAVVIQLWRSSFNSDKRHSTPAIVIQLWRSSFNSGDHHSTPAIIIQLRWSSFNSGDRHLTRAIVIHLGQSLFNCCLSQTIETNARGSALNHYVM